MQTYAAPLRDMRFALHELFADSPYALPAGAEATDPDVLDAILEEAARFSQEVLLPLNASGDAEGCAIENGVVRTPRGFREAYQQYRAAGWPSLVADPRWGGQGLPETLNMLIEEMVCATNVSFSLYPGLTRGATIAIERHASDALKALYLPKLVSGEWCGTMCLTEAHCGTDLGLLRAKAEPAADGRYRITGSKIFISSGDHDLADNIVHLVLARLTDAPAGVRGISLFLVPKFLPNAEGAPGERNAVTATALEHKMGIKAQATCQMSFDGAEGWLLAEPNQGLAAMFSMMNNERVAVGVQGLGLAEIAYQSAAAYAKERLQGRSPSGPKNASGPADPIIVHPDVRRMLMTMRTYAEGCRGLCQWVSLALGAEARHPDEAVRAHAADLVALLTPVVKALFTDLGFEAANLAVQTYGGHGYIRDHGIEQLVRDARIGQIYEGTNGVQAMDLVGRKLPAEGGRLLEAFARPIADLLSTHAGTSDPTLVPFAAALADAFDAWRSASDFIVERSRKDPEEAGAAAADYLRLTGLVGMGFTFLKASAIARARLEAASDEAPFCEAKLATAGFFFDRILPHAQAAFSAIRSGKGALMALPAEAF
jgi:alkylation response protein AidB-like acyl-CoA dehydrogenase